MHKLQIQVEIFFLTKTGSKMGSFSGLFNDLINLWLKLLS